MRILVVDDSADFLSAAAAFLRTLKGHQVVGCAASGEEAVERTKDLQPDLVLMDLLMPGIDGLEATRRIKALPTPPRVLVVSLHSESPYQLAAAQAAADGFVSKSDFAQRLPGLLQALERDSHG
jgi:DNA-binding NarL/FixJ family response regulator